MQSVCIAIVAFSATGQQYEIFKNTLVLAIKCAGDSLVLGELDEANLLVIWVRSDEDRQILDAYRNDYPAEQLVVVASDEFAIESYWQLSYPKNALMPSVLGMANLLGRIQAFFFLNPAADTFFVPDRSLHGLIQTALNDGIARKCQYPSCPDLYIVPNNQAVYFLQQPFDSLIPLLLADSQAITVTDISAGDVAEIVRQAQFLARLPQYVPLDEATSETLAGPGYYAYPLQHLQAFGILLASRGRLLPGHALADRVVLKQMPEGLGLDVYGADYQRIAACLGDGPISLEKVAEKTQCSLFQVIGFYNLCSIFGLVSKSAPDIAVTADDTVFLDDEFLASIGLLDSEELDEPFENTGNTGAFAAETIMAPDDSPQTAQSPDAAEWDEAAGMFDSAEWDEAAAMLDEEEAQTNGLFDAAEWDEAAVMLDDEEAQTNGLFDAAEWDEVAAMLGTDEAAQNAGEPDAAVLEDIDEAVAAPAAKVADSPSEPVSIESVFNAIAADQTNGRIKIIIGGSFGSGKSMAIAKLSDRRPVTTEMPLNSAENVKKTTTTVALDYGTMQLQDDSALVFYSTPGLKRFDFMFAILCTNAWGIILLIDNTEPDPLAELDRHLKLAGQFIGKIPIAIGITHCDINAQPSLDDYKNHLAQRGLALPVLEADARHRDSLVKLVCALAT